MQGLLLAISAYTIWGSFPLFFYYLSHVSPLEVLSHRVIWSLVATLLVGLVLGRWRNLLGIFGDKRLLGWLGISALLISVNWLIFIWAVTNGHALEASLGYFITPVISLMLARWFLKESLHPLQAVAGVVALLAIIWEVFSLGRLPWIGLSLALAFGFYGLIRKAHPVDGINGLSIETLWILPAAIGFVLWQIFTTDVQPAFAENNFNTLMLIGSGLLTALPLVLFAMAASRADLTVVGFIMYINPTIQFLIGVFVLNEPYPPERMITFVLVWISLLLFLWGMWQKRQQASAEHKKGA